MKRRCPNCGEALAKGANFCRTCGARYAASAPPLETPQPRVAERSAPASDAGTPEPRRARTAIAASAAILAIGAGAAIAILLGTGGGDSSTTTVVQDVAPTTTTTTVVHDVAPTTTVQVETTPEAGDSIEAGRYIQAGSFQIAANAQDERQRLAGHGIEVEVVTSDGAQELYPGFYVLLGGPLQSHAGEARMLQGLHQNGVPSAFARDLTPAAGIGEPVAGRWTGKVERTSSEHPRLNAVLPVTLALAPDEAVGSLDFSTIPCHADLSLTSKTSYVLTYSQEPACAGVGMLRIRSLGDELMLTLQSPHTDAFALGTLDRG